MQAMGVAQAYDAGGRARAAAGVVQALAQTKGAGVDADTALKLVGWPMADEIDSPRLDEALTGELLHFFEVFEEPLPVAFAHLAYYSLP